MEIKDLLTEKRKKASKKMPQAMERVPVFKQNQDMNSVISSIVYEMKDDNNKLAAKYNLPWTQMRFCNIKFTGDKLILSVEERKGGFKIRDENPRIINKQLAEIKQLMEKFEKSLKEEFKERTGKTLTLKNKETKADCNRVALNGLYRFFCIRSADASSKVEGQTFQD